MCYGLDKANFTTQLSSNDIFSPINYCIFKAIKKTIDSCILYAIRFLELGVQNLTKGYNIIHKNYNYVFSHRLKIQFKQI